MINDEYGAHLRQLPRPEPEPTKDLLGLERDRVVDALAGTVDEMDRLCAAIPTDTRGLRR